MVYLKSLTNPASEYIAGDAWNNDIGFDGSSISGFRTIHESDMNSVSRSRYAEDVTLGRRRLTCG